MPQLNILNYLSQTTWLILIIGLLHLLIKQSFFIEIYESYYILINNTTNKYEWMREKEHDQEHDVKEKKRNIVKMNKKYF